MRRAKTKLIIAGVVLALAMAYLVREGIGEGWVYFLEVDSFLADASYHDQRVRLHGKVGQDQVAINAAELSASFNLLGEAQQMPIKYTGIVPDTFKAGVEVVVEGKRDDQGVFQATVLMTKCASKYNEQSPHQESVEQTGPGEQGASL